MKKNSTLALSILSLAFLFVGLTGCDDDQPKPTPTTATATDTEYTVTFDANQGMLADSATSRTVQVSNGEKLPKPLDPTRDGSSFVEWQKEGVAFDFNAETIMANVTLTATWADAVGSLTDVAITLNAANTAYTVNYTYTNAQGTNTGGTAEITWFLADTADGTSATQVSTETTYTPTGVNRYKYLLVSVRVGAAGGGFTSRVRTVIFPGLSTEVTRGSTSVRFSGRGLHSSVVFNSKIWIIGGENSSYIKNDEVWSSADGINWTEAPDPTPRFSARSDHASVEFGGKIWVIGGGDDGGLKNDVWSSDDGSTWTQVTDPDDGAAFSARSKHTAVVFNGKIWVIGGGDQISPNNDVWSSDDGIKWSKAPDPTDKTPRFSARNGHASVDFDGKIWIIGGENSGYIKNDEVWSSADGINWTEAPDPTPRFSARSKHTAVVFDKKIWIIGGHGKFRLFGDSEFFSDVWY